MAEAGLLIDFKNRRPVELLDLTASLSALGQEYVDFVHSRGFDPKTGNIRLYVAGIRTGSIITELKAIAEQASLVLEHTELFCAFVANLDDIVKYFLGRPRVGLDYSPVSKSEASRVAQVLEPVAKDSGSQLILSVTGDINAPITININSEEANAVQNGVRRFLGPPIPTQGRFEKEVLYLRQVSGDAKAKVGDRGTIERFSTKPVRLEFMNEPAKRAVLDQPFPFAKAYLVDGQAGTVEGEPVLYKIYAVDDVLDR